MTVNDDDQPVLRSPAPERGGATVDEAVATAEAGSQVDGVHTPSGQAASGDSRVEHMVDEPVSEPRVEGNPGSAANPPGPGPSPTEIGSGGAQRIVGARISDRVAGGEPVPEGPPFTTPDPEAG